MITRVVKMYFQEPYVHDFVKIYEQISINIKNVSGCVSLQLLQDIKEDTVFFTFSKWESKAHLQAYRSSELFRSTWSTIRPWFGQKPRAWTLKAIR